MIEPCHAPVRPRALAPATGASLLLETLVFDPANLARQGPIQIVGGPGSGKTTALRHLAAMHAELPRSDFDADVVFLDEPTDEEIAAHVNKGKEFLVMTANEARPYPWLTFRLDIWGEDEILEYLLARYRAHCGPILSGLRKAGDFYQLEGIAELWTLTLDHLAGAEPKDEGEPVPLRPLEALRAAFIDRAATAEVFQLVGQVCLEFVCGTKTCLELAEQDSIKLNAAAGEGSQYLVRLLRHGPLQRVMAADRIASTLQEGKPCRYLHNRLPRGVIHLAAEQIRYVPQAVAQVKSFLTENIVGRQPMAASICQRLDPQWLRNFPVSKTTPLPVMNGAYLDHADWAGLDLTTAKFRGADLSFVNLSGATLERADLVRANLHGAVLAGANLREVYAQEAHLGNADLSNVKAVEGNFDLGDLAEAILDRASFHRASLQKAVLTGASLSEALFTDAKLEGANFADADCTGTDFSGAKFEAADFRTARLDGARSRTAQLAGCNFEEVVAADVYFSGANLKGALLTGSSLARADFTGADLRQAGLAEIDWENANLSEADLRGASFHLGSSRSGRVGSPIALEGSMTGFYTDDFNEQDFKAPEEIRKANLRGADLRGANIEGVDFYLVDLREALYDETQALQLRNTGAILRDRECES